MTKGLSKNNERPAPKAPSHLQGISAIKRHEQRRKVVTFLIGAREYAFEAQDMPEVCHAMPITEVPRAPGFIKGIIPFKGNMLVVIDLKKRLGMEGTAKDTIARHSKMLIAGAEKYQSAFLVDAIAGACEAVPGPLDAPEEKDIFVKGLINMPGRSISVLSIEKLLNVNIAVPAKKIAVMRMRSGRLLRIKKIEDGR